MTGKGEAEAIILAKECRSKLLIDDAQGRKHAELLNLKFIGCLGLVKMAKKQGLEIGKKLPACGGISGWLGGNPRRATGGQ